MANTVANAIAQAVNLADGGRKQFPWPKAFLQANSNLQVVGASSGNTAQIIVAAVTGEGQDANIRPFVLKQVFGGYNAAAAGGMITVTDGTTTLTFFTIEGGTETWNIDPPISFTPGHAVTATINGVAGVTGAMMLNGWVEF